MALDDFSIRASTTNGEYSLLPSTIRRPLGIDSLSLSFCSFRMVFLHSSTSRVSRWRAFSLIAKSTRIPRTVASKCVSSLVGLDGFDVRFIADGTPLGFDTTGDALGDLSSV